VRITKTNHAKEQLLFVGLIMTLGAIFVVLLHVLAVMMSGVLQGTAYDMGPATFEMRNILASAAIGGACGLLGGVSRLFRPWQRTPGDTATGEPHDRKEGE